MSLMGAADNERAYADRLAPGSVISILLEQHALIRTAFAAVQLARGERRRELFDELRELLALHEAGEETVLRLVSRKSAGYEVVDALDREERLAARLLAELETMDVDSERFAHDFAVLEKAVSEHAEHEELEEFTAVQGAHTDEELQSMGEKLLKAQRKAPTHPHRFATGSPAALLVVRPFAVLLDKARDAYKG